MIKKNIRASSLANAIFICLIISIFCSALVLISHYNNLLGTQLEMRNHLISRNHSAFNYFINNVEELNYDEVKKVDIFNDGIYTYAQKKSWGFYDILISKTIFKKDTISKVVLIGEQNTKNNKLAMYATNYDNSLKLSGKTTILGNVEVPNGRIEQAYINNNIGNKIYISGSQQKSKDNLPRVSKNLTLDFSNYKQYSLSSENSDTLINGFDEETKVFNIDGADLGRLVAIGNIVLTSKKRVVIEANTELSDVVILAPKIFIRAGFKGNLQIIADSEVIVDEDVSLKYPSSIYVQNDIDSVLVKIKSNSKLVGGVVVNGKTYQGALRRVLEIDQNATVVGEVYCYGRTQLKGDIIGSIYTDRFFLNTKSSRYENLLLNVSINKDSLPKEFIGLNLFNSIEAKKVYGNIKTF